MDVVRIIGLELDCIVGIRAYERQREQRVRLDLDLGVDTRKAGRSGRIAQTVDYDMVAHHLMAMLRFRRYQLIEMAAEELCAMLLATEPELLQAKLRIEKPGALEGRAQAACVEVSRTASDFQPLDVPSLDASAAPGTERQVLRTRDAALFVTEVNPGRSWTPAHASATRCLMWPVRGELLGDAQRLETGRVVDCEHVGHQTWVNDSAVTALVFRCEVPPPVEPS